MVNSCCAVHCHNTFVNKKFPEGPNLRAKWITAVHCEQFVVNILSWMKETLILCLLTMSQAFSVMFPFLKKRKLKENLSIYERRKGSKRKRTESIAEFSGVGTTTVPSIVTAPAPVKQTIGLVS